MTLMNQIRWIATQAPFEPKNARKSSMLFEGRTECALELIGSEILSTFQLKLACDDTADR